ncbi:MAG: ParB N-terminal domain-containing protein [Litoreibacter sp.]
MAKRKRLGAITPRPESGAEAATEALAGKRASRGPIAHVAGEAATSAALETVTEALHAARSEGRLLLQLSLDKVDADHLVRDRLAVDDEDMQGLIESIRARGQQTAIEVLELKPGYYGLISGWRRLHALRQIGAETVLAQVRQHDTATDAYVAMVEENEIRANLSFYERGRIAAKAAELGLYADTGQAVQKLFGNASRSKRSKINSFVALHHKLGSVLRFPTAISERLGLALVSACDADAGLAVRLKDRLRKAAIDTAQAEIDLLSKAVAMKPTRASQERKPKSVSKKEKLSQGVVLETNATDDALVLTLSGTSIDAAFRKQLVAWIKEHNVVSHAKQK